MNKQLDTEYRHLENETFDQIIHFKGGYKRTIYNVEYIWENEMTHIVTADGIEWLINKDNVLCVEVIRRKYVKNQKVENQ